MSQTDIHPTAVIDPRARLGHGVSVGAYSVIEDGVIVGDDCRIGTHVRLAAGAELGPRCHVFQGAAVGSVPQDLKFDGAPTRLVIGSDTTIREGCTLNRGTQATGETVVGSHCYLMAFSHVAHDCRVGDHFVCANQCNLAGHVRIGNHVTAGGVAAVAQFCRVGDHAFLGAYSRICRDILPFALVAPEPMRVAGVNRVGLRRAGFDEVRRRRIELAYKVVLRGRGSLAGALDELVTQFPGDEDVHNLVTFARASRCGLLRMRTPGRR